MTLESLISDFKEADFVVRQMINREASKHDLQSADMRSQELLHAIRDYSPAGMDELKNKFTFFVDRLKADIQNVSDAFAVDALVEILDRDFSYSMNSLNTTVNLDGSIHSEENKFKLVSAYDLVSKSHDRISIVDQNFRYVNTSSTNSAFYKEKSHKVIGRHVGELIGENRFQHRAKRFFNNCFSGKKQDYFHALETNNGSRIMSCQMIPLYNGESRVFGSLVAMNDVTDIVADPNSILLEQLPS